MYLTNKLECFGLRWNLRPVHQLNVFEICQQNFGQYYCDWHTQDNLSVYTEGAINRLRFQLRPRSVFKIKIITLYVTEPRWKHPLNIFKISQSFQGSMITSHNKFWQHLIITLLQGLAQQKPWTRLCSGLTKDWCIPFYLEITIENVKKKYVWK